MNDFNARVPQRGYDCMCWLGILILTGMALTWLPVALPLKTRTECMTIVLAALLRGVVAFVIVPPLARAAWLPIRGFDRFLIVAVPAGAFLVALGHLAVPHRVFWYTADLALCAIEIAPLAFYAVVLPNFWSAAPEEVPPVEEPLPAASAPPPAEAKPSVKEVKDKAVATMVEWQRDREKELGLGLEEHLLAANLDAIDARYQKLLDAL